MLKRHWLPIVAAVGLALILGAMGHGKLTEPRCADVLKALKAAPPSPEEDYEAHYSGAVTCHRDCQVSFSGSGNGSPVSDSHEKQADAYCNTPDELDLLAQDRMAHWTAYIAGLTAIGLIVLAGTLFEAFRATGAAQIAADAAKLQAQAAINAGRAFFSPLDPRIEPNSPYRKDEALDSIMGFHARVHNRGLGPGFLRRFALGHEVVDLGGQPAGSNLKVSDYLGRITIEADAEWGAGENTALLTFRLSDDEIAQMTNTGGMYWLHVFGYFEYTDLFGVLRQTGFHYSYIPTSKVLIIERPPRLWFDRIVEEPGGQQS